MKRSAIVVCLLAATAGAAAQQNNALYGATDLSGARFGASIGAGAAYRPAPADANVQFGGKAALSCTGIDLNAFLRTFKPQELVTELKGSLLNGAQAFATNTVLMLAYANPTIASVLDMMDQRYSARFSAFAEQCNAAQARARGQSEGARQMAAGQDQCFSRRVQQGDSPTEAYRECAKAATIAALDLPATAGLREYLPQYASVDMNRALESMLGLLPDAKTTAQGVQVRPPSLSVPAAHGNVSDWAANALRALLNGSDPGELSDCPPEVIATPIGNANDRCIPAAAASLVRSPAFLSARLLSAAEQQLYVAAFAEQIAAVEVRARIVQLRQELSRMAPRPQSEASADDVLARRDALLKEVQKLEADTLALEAVTGAKAQLARTQILAMQRAAGRLASVRAAAERAGAADGNGFVGGLRALFGLQP